MTETRSKPLPCRADVLDAGDPGAGPADPAGGVVDTVRAALVADLDVGFAELMHRYQGVVYSMALRVTRRPADAEDLTAESFLRAYGALRGYDTARLRALAPRPWLSMTVINTRRDQVRDAAHRPQPRGEEGPQQLLAGHRWPDQVHTSALADELGALLGRLPDAQRAAAVLRHVENLGIAEVAEILGCPIGTAKSHVDRGLHLLRLWIDQCASDRSVLVSTGSPP